MSSPAAINALLQKAVLLNRLCVSRYIYLFFFFFFQASADANSSCLHNKDTTRPTILSPPPLFYYLLIPTLMWKWPLRDFRLATRVYPVLQSVIRPGFVLRDRTRRTFCTDRILLPASRRDPVPFHVGHAVENVESELYFYEGDLTALCSSAQRVGRLTRQ